LAKNLSSTSRPPRDLTVPEIKLPVRFEARDIDAAIKSLRSTPIPPRLKLLPKVLGEWATVYLPEYSRAAQISLPEEVRSLKKWAKDADALKPALADPHNTILRDHLHLALGPEMDNAALRFSYEHVDNKIVNADTNASELVGALQAYITRVEPRRGRPRNFLSPKVLTDLADIFHWLTDQPPTRAVNPNEDTDCGEFHDFCAALWPAIFANGDHGLPAALKVWAGFIIATRDPAENELTAKRYRNLSALIANLNMQFPEWLLYKR
jgi:hypothetical protein